MRHRALDTNRDGELAEFPMEQRFQQLFGNMADAAYLIESGSGSILACNESAELQTGYSKAELIGKNIAVDLEIQDPDISAATVTQRIEARESVRFIDRKQRKNGTLYWDEVVLIPFQSDSEPVHVSINRDISDRAAREVALRESEIRYRSIFESTTDAVLVFDRDGIIVEANPKACRMYGFEPTEFIGVPANRVISAKTGRRLTSKYMVDGSLFEGVPISWPSFEIFENR